MDIKSIITAILFLAAAGAVFVYASRLGTNLAGKAGL